jgi:hypothetical protein
MLGDIFVKPFGFEPQPTPPTLLEVSNATPLDHFAQPVRGHPKVFGGGG